MSVAKCGLLQVLGRLSLALVIAFQADFRAGAILVRKVLVTSQDAIPKDPHKSWSLFLVCNPSWLLPENSGRLQNLRKQFDAFGEAIGPDHLAIWFEERDDPRVGQFCTRFRLRPTSGPHVLVTTTFPDPKTPPGDFLALELGGSDSVQIASALAKLADQLLVTGLTKQNASSEQYWRTWVGAIRTGLVGFQNTIRLTVDTKFFKVASARAS